MTVRDFGVRLECDCCGRAAAEGVPGMDLIVSDGQRLACGCRGHISVDSETEPSVWIDECDCGGHGNAFCAHPGLTEKVFPNGVLAECPDCLYRQFIENDDAGDGPGVG